jgi:hypothetical protein
VPRPESLRLPDSQRPWIVGWLVLQVEYRCIAFLRKPICVKLLLEALTESLP